MAESRFSEVTLTSPKAEYSPGENVEITAEFSIQGGIRNAFNEGDWTKAYEANDVSFKLKYGARLVTAGGFRKKAVGRPVDTYRKASIFWTRNPKLVNPMKDKRIWVQVAKNFEPYIRLSEEEVPGRAVRLCRDVRHKAVGAGRRGHAQDRRRGVRVVAKAPVYRGRKHKERLGRNRDYDSQLGI